MNRRFRTALIVLAVGPLLSSCNNATPENYFDEAVLNVNLITPFGGQAALYSMAHPSVKLVPGTKDQTAPMTRKEIVEDQIQRVEQNLTKIKALPESEATRDMVQASIKLHEFVLPVYKTEYRELAKLYDEGGSQQDRISKAQEIDTKYLAAYKALFSRLIELGKAYAEKHHIKVEWQTLPF
jgi:TRAP-type mannitol/chloroaromatic compound transport system substrate-binding protein